MKTENRIVKTVLLISFLMCCAITGFSKSPVKITGVWMNKQETRKVEFYQEGGKYFGKVVWVAASETELKEGDILFKNMTWDGEDLNGKVSTPKGDATCSISFFLGGSIQVIVSKGVLWKTFYWTKIK
jgi:uncharacterized protein (DUF2147 family)